MHLPLPQGEGRGEGEGIIRKYSTLQDINGGMPLSMFGVRCWMFDVSHLLQLFPYPKILRNVATTRS